MFFAEKDKLQAVRKEMRSLSSEAGKYSKSLGQSGKSMQKMSKEFASGIVQMQLQVKKLREEMNQTSRVKPPTFFERFGNFTNKLGEFNQKIVSIANDISQFTMGTSLDAINDEAKAAAKERGLYAAKGKTPEEMKRFDQLADKLAVANPYLNRPQVMSLISKSEQVNPKQAEKYAEHAAKLSVTTKYAPEDHLKMMAAMRQGTDIDDVDRLANSIQFMSNHAGDLNGKFVESIVDFSSQTGKFLDTPEKMATMVGEIGKLGIWNDEKAFGSLRESAVKFTDQGELTKLLQSQYELQGKGKEATGLAEKESAAIAQALAAGDRDEQRIALGKMMVSLSTIQDKAVQQKVLQNLGGNAWKDLGADFPRLLETAGKIASGETRTTVGNEAEESYQAATEENVYFKKLQEQAAARQEAIEAATNFAKDMSGLFEELSSVTASVIGWFNNLDSSIRVLVEGIGLGAVALTSVGHVTDLVSVGGEMLDAGRNVFQRKDKGAAGDTSSEHDAGGSKGQVDSDKKQSTNPPTDTGNEPNTTDKPPKKSWLSKLKNVKGLAKRVPLLGTLLSLPAIFTSKNKLDTAAQIGSESLGGWGGAAAGAAAGAALGSVVPLLGTAVGGLIGGAIGGIGGSMLGSAAYDGLKSWFQGSFEVPTSSNQPIPSGPPMPESSPTNNSREQPQSVSITIPQLTIPLHADGVLQDIPSMLKMLGDPSVGQKIKSIIEKSLLDALETRGGVPA